MFICKVYLPMYLKFHFIFFCETSLNYKSIKLIRVQTNLHRLVINRQFALLLEEQKLIWSKPVDC